jgi:hypothetical protein
MQVYEEDGNGDDSVQAPGQSKRKLSVRMEESARRERERDDHDRQLRENANSMEATSFTGERQSTETILIRTFATNRLSNYLPMFRREGERERERERERSGSSASSA